MAVNRKGTDNMHPAVRCAFVICILMAILLLLPFVIAQIQNGIFEDRCMSSGGVAKIMRYDRICIKAGSEIKIQALGRG